MVAFMLDMNGIEVIELGIDVPVNIFLEKLKETQAPIVGFSGFLTRAYDAMKETIKAFKTVWWRWPWSDET